MLYHVTGAQGRVGQEVTAALGKIGSVQGTDVQDMDVTNIESVRRTLLENPPDVIVHLAGLKGNIPSQLDPLGFFNVNTSGTLNLLEVSREIGVKQFVFFSSLTVHGPTDSAINELSPLFPQHPYSGSKASSEFMVHAYANAYGMQCTIFRPNFIVAAIPQPLPYVDNLIYDFIELIHDEGVIELAGEGQYEREWMHPYDVAEAVVAAVKHQHEGSETYILRGERVTMYEFASRIVKQVGKGEITTNPDRTGFSIISSGAKAEKELGFRLSINLDTLITQIWNEYRTRHGR